MPKPIIDQGPISALDSSPALQLTEKIDGQFAEAKAGRAHLVGEYTRDGAFHPFDIIHTHAEPCATWPLRERWKALHWQMLCYPPPFETLKKQPIKKLELVAQGIGTEFLEAVLAKGGEGVVAKPWDAPYASGWLKFKRSEVFRCRVTSINFENGVVDLTFDGAPAGRLALRDKSLLVRVGSVLKVEAYGRHKSGLLREARLDRDSEDSWLVQF